MLTICTHRRFDSLPAAPWLESWRGLAPTPMQSPDWMLSWWAAFRSSNAEPIVLEFLLDDHAIGFVPLMMRRDWVFGRTLRWLGSGTACSDYQTLLVQPQHAQRVAHGLVEWLTVGEGRGSWDVLELDGTSAPDARVESVLAELKARQALVQTSPLERTWRLDLQGGWERVLRDMSRTTRSQCRNFVKQFDEHGQFKLQRYGYGDQLSTALTTAIKLHQLRWEAVGLPGCFADRRFELFLRAAFEQLAKQRQAEVVILELDGQGVACQFILLDNQGGEYMYQSGRDPAFDDQRVGQLLNAICIRDACQRGAPFIDYLRGDETYKSRLHAQPIENHRVRVFAPAALPRLRYAAWKVGRDLKQHTARIAEGLRNPAKPTR